jgi:hypothetical protein
MPHPTEKTLRLIVLNSGQFTELANSNPISFAEVDQKISITSSCGLEISDLIAIVNDTYDVHVLKPARPGHFILTISDPSTIKAKLDGNCYVVDLFARQELNLDVKKFLAAQAARVFCVPVRAIHVIA